MRADDPGVGAVTEAGRRRPPPKLLVRVFNALPRVLLCSPLHGLMSEKTLLFGFTGRKSGKRYLTPMSYARVGDEILMSTEAPWWKNLVGGVPVELVLRGRRRSGFAEAVTEEAGIVDGLKTIVRLYPGYRRFVGVAVDGEGRPEEKTVVGAARRGRVVVRVRLTG